jgi:hypothetical protein
MSLFAFRRGTVWPIEAALLAFTLFHAVLGTAYGQLSTASVNGTVRDASGSVIPGALVVLRNQDTGVGRQAVTNDAGNYVFLNILPGAYTLEASKTGLSTQRLQPFQLSVNQTATLDFTLAVAAVSETVTVMAEGAELQSSTSELGGVVAQKQVADLPLNGRNFTQLLSLTPGVAPVSVSQNSGGSFLASSVGQFNFPAINGQTNRSNYFLLDGINDMEPFNSGYVVPPIIDQIQEFKVQSHNDQAEFGMAMGGTVNVVTKSGTNELHGSAWEYIRNNAFDARNFFLPSKQPLRQNQFGASGGGPVVLPKLYNGRNRTFFFLAYQGFRFRQPAANFYRVPTVANLQGDLSDWPLPIYNPLSTRLDPSRPGTFVRDAFPGNRIPASLIDRGTVLYAKTVLPPPIATGLADRNALDTTPRQTSQEEYSARVDQNLGTKDFVWFRYSGLLLNTSASPGIQAIATTQENRAKNWGVSWVRTFSPTSVLQVQVGRSATRLDTVTRYRNLPADFVQSVGWDKSWAGGFQGSVPIVPSLQVNGFFTGFNGDSDSLQTPTHVWQEKAIYSKTYGNHTFKLGGELNSNGIRAIFRLATATFAPAQTADPSRLGNTGSALGSFLLNVPDTAQRRNTLQETRWGGVMSYFFTDQWKATSRLTLNLGIRYDRTFIPAYGRQVDVPGGIETGNFDFNRGVYVVQVLPPSCAERGHAPCIPGGKLPEHVEVSPNRKLIDDTTKNFQPRVGLAYRLGSSTTIRTGFGVVFDNWAGVLQTTTNSFGLWPDLGILTTTNLNYPTASNPTPVVTGTNPIPTGAIPPPTPFTTVGWFMDPHLKNPYSMQWNFGVQHQFSPTTVLDASYVGSGSRRLDVGGYYNTALTPGPGDSSVRRLYPYETPTYYDRSIGNGSYHALQMRLDKKLSHGLVYMVSYTWSKAIDQGCSGWFGVEGCSIQDPYNIRNERSVAGFDLTQVLTVNWVYLVPVGAGKTFQTGNRFLDYVVGNWQLNGITVARSGLPYDVGVSGDVANTGNIGRIGYYDRLNLVGNPNPSNPTPQRWLNPAGFAAPAPYTFGNLGRNTLRSDRSINFDFSLFRQFPIRERKMAEFRAEAFNVFNHPVFGVPVRNFNDPNFGKVLGLANYQRQLQLGLKLFF